MLVSAHSSLVPKQARVPSWWIALTSRLLSRWMWHQTTCSDEQNQKHSAAGLRHTREVKVEVARIHFQTQAIAHVDEWPEITANDETKFVLVMYGVPLRAVLLAHMSAQLNVFSSIKMGRDQHSRENVSDIEH